MNFVRSHFCQQADTNGICTKCSLPVVPIRWTSASNASEAKCFPVTHTVSCLCVPVLSSVELSLESKELRSLAARVKVDPTAAERLLCHSLSTICGALCPHMVVDFLSCCQIGIVVFQGLETRLFVFRREEFGGLNALRWTVIKEVPEAKRFRFLIGVERSVACNPDTQTLVLAANKDPGKDLRGLPDVSKPVAVHLTQISVRRFLDESASSLLGQGEDYIEPDYFLPTDSPKAPPPGGLAVDVLKGVRPGSK